MPIYAYRCSDCGHAQDVLQKLSDPVLTTCPVCGAEAYAKQVTAAGFQLKGSGWYVTDFRNGNQAAPKPGDAAKTTADAAPGEAAPAADKPAADKPAAAPPASAPATAAKPASSPAASPAAAPPAPNP
ncbi:MAG: zinc ribbon domain-containing protein [Ideonella sp. WA131b]|jgi:putative FmdB family regulatory protein|nr:zinc ribbon domain-containing protein [Ideonella sp. WA131b]